MMSAPRQQRPAVRALLLASIAAMPGCRLVDQTSFGHAPRAPAPDAATAALAAPADQPLLVIRPDEAVPYQAVLLQVLQAVQAHHGSAQFRLESVAPASGDLDAQQAALARAAGSAREVLDEMGVDGVPSDRVALSARTDARIDRTELRLYRI